LTTADSSRESVVRRLFARGVEVVRRPRTRWVVVLPFFAFVLLRDPALFAAPQFWAEEGTHYFHHAFVHSWHQALFDLSAAPHNPYWHPIPHLATIAAANWMPLESAPAFTSAVWCGVVLVLALVTLYGRAELIRGAWRRAFALSVPLLAVANSENWMNTLGAHFYCDIALLFLLLEARSVAGIRRWCSVAAFTLLALISPSSWILVPAAVVASYGALRSHRPYLISLACAVAMHVALAWFGFPERVRNLPELDAVPHLFASKLVLWPLTGPNIAGAYAEVALHLGDATYRVSAIGLGIAIVGAYAGTWGASLRDRTTLALLVTHLASAAGAFLLGLHVTRDLLPLFHGGRYAWLPNALLLLVVAHQLLPPPVGTRVARQGVFVVLLLAAVTVAVLEFRYPRAVREWMRAPSWREEVEAFRADPSYRRLRIAPAGWVVVIPSP
jgi:hypothetical protein